MREALAANGRGHGGHHADRREPHDVAGDLEHDLRDGVEQRGHRAALLPRRRYGDAEEGREDHHLQHVVAGQRIDQRGREHVQDDVPGALLASGHRLQLGDAGRFGRDAGAGPQQVDQAEPEHQRERGGDLEVDERLGADPAHRLQVARAGNPDDQRREQQRPDDHLDHPQEDVGQRAELGGERRPQPADDDAQHQAEHDARGGARTAAARRGDRRIREPSGDAAGRRVDGAHHAGRPDATDGGRVMPATTASTT